MEEFKSINELTQIDEKHELMVDICGYLPSLKRMHEYLSKEVLNDDVPDEIKNQFNVARNMAIYSYYFYSISAEVHLKTYILIEYALRIKINPEKKLTFKQLLGIAIGEKLISDKGFRCIDNSSENNEWCKSLVELIPDLRNPMAHSPGLLVGDCLHHISVCADFINQLFPKPD